MSESIKPKNDAPKSEFQKQTRRQRLCQFFDLGVEEYQYYMNAQNAGTMRGESDTTE